jgi:hypothetical protein
MGYKRLLHAIEIYQKTYPGGSKDKFEITWLPYFLDGNLPEGSPGVVMTGMAKLSLLFDHFVVQTGSN